VNLRDALAAPATLVISILGSRPDVLHHFANVGQHLCADEFLLELRDVFLFEGVRLDLKLVGPDAILFLQAETRRSGHQALKDWLDLTAMAHEHRLHEINILLVFRIILAIEDVDLEEFLKAH